MINGIRFKVCGLTSLVDAELAETCGADFLGFIFYPKSPRYISLDSYRAIAPHFTRKPRVAVTVEPSDAEIAQLKLAGFEYFQIHFSHTVPLDRVAAWSDAISPTKLWLAPRIPAGTRFETAYLSLAGTFLFDTFQSGTYGGTGKTGDWGAFARLQKEFSRVNWILAGGLNAENIVEALAATQARVVDVNSGVESVPGIKSAEKLKAFCAALAKAPVLGTKPPFASRASE